MLAYIASRSDCQLKLTASAFNRNPRRRAHYCAELVVSSPTMAETITSTLHRTTEGRSAKIYAANNQQ